MAFKVIGKNLRRYDGIDHVTGETRFVDDVIVPGTLMIKAFRSPVVKGRIKKLDISAAESLPGVAGVITARDVPCNRYGDASDQPVLAGKKIRYQGEPIAAVAAADEAIATKALAKIKIEIETEEPVFDPLAAMQPDAPKVRPEGNLHQFENHPFRQVVFGDVDAGFKAADFIIENTYHHAALEHAQLEPMVSLAVPKSNGNLTIYTVSQALHFHLEQLSGILQQNKDKINFHGQTNKLSPKKGFADIEFVGGTVGGAFGGKNDIHADHVAALLALKTGRPCKWRWTREEDLLYSTFRGPWQITIKDGVKKDGRIVARKIESILDCGSYTTCNPMVVEQNTFLSSGPYFIPNVYSRGYCVFTNKPPASSMRGFGITPSTFATEVQANRIAAKLGMDPWEFRFLNAYRKGDLTPTKRALGSVSLIEVMQTLAEKAGLKLPDHLNKMTSAQRGPL